MRDFLNVENMINGYRGLVANVVNYGKLEVSSWNCRLEVEE